MWLSVSYGLRDPKRAAARADMSQTQSPAIDVGALRAAEFPFLEGAAYLNAASVGPLPERSRRALAHHSELRARIHTFADGDILDPMRRSREAAARLVGAQPSEIALLGNTSYGINLAALSLPVEPGTRVITSDREFPANVYPWMGREDFELELVPTTPSGLPDEDAILERLDEGDVSILALSAVQFVSGYRADLARIGRACRARGIHFVVDAIQALGQIPIDVHEMRIDVLATGGHKWLLSPFGTGFAFVRSGLIAEMRPRMVGWTAMSACDDLEHLLDYSPGFRPDARRFEVATLPFQDFAAFAESLELLLEIGVPAIERHLADILAPLEEWLAEHEEVELLSDRSPEHRSGIVSFVPPDPDAVFAALSEAGVVCVLREGAVRLAPHVYSTADDILRVVAVLAREVAG
jgi:cysteine desulfurase/selenocysteine lyase